MRPQIRPAMYQLCLIVLALSCSSTVYSQRLTDERYRALLEQLQPSEDQPWRTIPWKITMLDAQRAAAKDKKPIFIWAMDGHPLGCT